MGAMAAPILAGKEADLGGVDRGLQGFTQDRVR